MKQDHPASGGTLARKRSSSSPDRNDIEPGAQEPLPLPAAAPGIRLPRALARAASKLQRALEDLRRASPKLDAQHLPHVRDAAHRALLAYAPHRAVHLLDAVHRLVPHTSSPL